MRWSLLLAVAAVLPGQEVALAYEAEGRQLCTVRGLLCAGAPGGTGFARIEVENSDTREHELLVELATPRWVEADVRVHRTFRLAPAERAAAFLPLPGNLPPLRLALTVAGVENAESLPVGRSEGLVGMLVSDRPDSAPEGLALLHGARSGFSAAPVQRQVGVAQAPADWRLFTGFHVVVLDGRAAAGAELQEALRCFAFAGGNVVVATPASLPAGPLRTLLDGAPPGERRAHGLGVLLPLPNLDRPGSDALAVLGLLDDGPLPVAQPLQCEAPIPGLGEAPVRVFLSVIVLFALLAGPVNFLLLRRWRRPLLALITVPAAGFGTTLVILGYGFLHDGFGTRGVATSWTLLDQGRHEAATVCARTLFAGRAPGAFAPAADTLLLAPRATEQRRRGADRWHHDTGADRLDGGLLPSRTPTPLVTVQQGVARQRLVARVRGDELELLTDGGVVPAGEIVLRDFDGVYWLGGGSRLRAAAADAGQRALARMRAAGGSLEVAMSQRVEYRPGRFRELPEEVRSAEVGALAERCLPAALPPGSYVTRVDSPAWLDGHGLTVAHDAQQHFVFGRMGAEDFVR